MGKKKGKAGVKITFCGTNATEVTGSMTLVQTPETQFLIECGLNQSAKTPLESYRINNRKFNFRSKDVKFTIICHNHIDHLGILPLLVKRGFTGKIYIPEMNFGLARILLEDTAFILDRDAELIRKQGREVEPIYTMDDVKETLKLMEEIPFGQKFDVDENISFKFSHSGHITNSAHAEIWITDNNVTKKIYYTSDLGNRTVPSYYVHSFEPVSQANLVIGESTYSNPDRQVKPKDRDCDLDKIKCVVEQTMEKKGRVLIPVFANHRCQTMLTVLYELYGNNPEWSIPIYVDSPMACKISKLMCHIVNEEQMHQWEKVMTWKNVHFISEYNDSKALQGTDEPCIILSSSGMLAAGRSVTWSQKLLGSSKNHFLFCGYAPEGSLADKIKKGEQKYITIEGKSVPNKAYVTKLTSFSSHIQHDDMLEYYSEINCEKIALVHGNFADKEKFCKELQETISKKNKTTKVVCVNNDTTITL